MVKLLVACIAALALVSSVIAEKSAAVVISEMYSTCLKYYSASCVKHKALSWLSKVADQDKIKITEDLLIIKTEDGGHEAPRSMDPQLELFNSVDNFLATHKLKIKVPEGLRAKDMEAFLPRTLLQNIPENLEIPLGEDTDLSEGRSGFVKKVMVPFLLGLKFKASVLVPMAIALIALTTWKALTLGLLSLVLSGAMVIFKFTKPKQVINYEVVHYPQHVEHHVEHPPPSGWEHNPHGYGRGLDAQQMAYNAHQ